MCGMEGGGDLCGGAVTWIRIDWRIRLDALGPQIRLDAFDPQIRLDAFERCSV